MDIIFSSSAPATKAARDAVAGTDVAVVFGPVNDPVGANIVDSLNMPGGQITGVTLPRNTAQRFAWFKEFMPDINRVLIPFNPNDPSSTTSLNRVKSSLDEVGITIVEHPVRDVAGLRALLQDLPVDVGGIFLPRDAMVTSLIEEVVAAAIARKLALSVPGYLQVEKGALYSYGFFHYEIGRMGARLVQSIFNGENPANLPVETADSFLFINKKTADAIGLDLSPDLLAQAKQIVR